MRTNIVIDDKLMADVMTMGGFKTKREAVEEGLRMIKRRKTYDGLLALRGQLHWDDSDEGWAKYRAEQTAKAQAQAAGLPFEGELDPAFQIQPLKVQEPKGNHDTTPGEPT